MVSEDRTDDVRQWIQNGKTTELKEFLKSAADHFQVVSHWIHAPEADNTQLVMVCLIEPVNHTVIGLPLLSAACFSHRVGFTSPLQICPDTPPRQGRSVRIADVESFSIRRDEIGQPHVFVSTSARVDSLSTLLDNGCSSTNFLALSHKSDSTAESDFHSVHISALPDTKSIATYIIEKLDDANNRPRFIDSLKKAGIDWREIAEKIGALSVSSGVQPDADTVSDEDEENLADDWILLKSFVNSNPERNLEVLQRGFDIEPTTWKTFICPMTEGKASLYMSMAQSIRAFVFLIALECNQDEGEYELTLPTLHEAAMNDDSSLLEWLLQIGTGSIEDMLQTTDKEGFTVLQAACRVGSTDVVDLVTSERVIDNIILTELISETSRGGDTALHVSLKCDYPLILHKLLKGVEREERIRLMTLRDIEGRTCEETTSTDTVKYRLAAAVLKCKSKTLTPRAHY